MRKTSDKTSDGVVQRLETALSTYGNQHAKAQITVKRLNPATVRVRIVDPDFAKLDKAARHDLVWPLIEQLCEEDLNHLTMVLLLTPREGKSSLSNLEFDRPSRSLL